jgi:hypothetical protein
MIHITVQGGVVTGVKKAAGYPDTCIITDYDNNPSDREYFFPTDTMTETEARKVYGSANAFYIRRMKADEKKYKQKMKAKKK